MVIEAMIIISFLSFAMQFELHVHRALFTSLSLSYECGV
jgi:hypothetical protein